MSMKFLVLGGWGYLGFFWGGSAYFIFMGARIFLILDFQRRAQIISIVQWKLRLVIFSVEKAPCFPKIPFSQPCVQEVPMGCRKMFVPVKSVCSNVVPSQRGNLCKGFSQQVLNVGA